MKHRSHLLLLAGVVWAVSSCGSGGGGSSASGGSSGMVLIEASNGFGKLLPYQIAVPDAQGMPTNDVIEITTVGDLERNLTPTNGVKAPTEWKIDAVLPNNDLGNHFVTARFSRPVDELTVLIQAAATGGDNNLVGNIQVVQVEPLTGATIPIAGRGFIGGMTFGSADPGNPTQLLYERWVDLDANGKPIAVDARGLGFPGTQSALGFGGANELVDPRTFVFVVDSDGDLTTHETFPSNVQIQLKIGRGVKAADGRTLEQEALASSTVGPDTVPPEVLVSGAGQIPVIIPGNGDMDVDPETNIEVTFTEPIQFLTVGTLDDGTAPPLSSAIQLQFGPSTAKVDVPFTVRPFSVFDLSRLELQPAYNFPGSGPEIAGVSCGAFSTVEVIVNSGQFEDLCANPNTLAPRTDFTTKEGAGIVNAPVTPDTIYIARTGQAGGISVIDLNGFGQGPGNPDYDIQNPIQLGASNFPNNPNVSIQGSLLIPPLTPGTCVFDGGSAGPFTLARDTSMNDIVVGSSILETVGDMALGHALDNTFNNASPFGCQAGGGNICSQTALKQHALSSGGATTLAPSTASIFPTKTEFGRENIMSWAPHPNPPPLVFPPTCLSPLIAALEPTSIDTVGGGTLDQRDDHHHHGHQQPARPGPVPARSARRGHPAPGHLVLEQNAFFQGPSAPQPSIATCSSFGLRQQIGNFMYVVDRVASQIVVLNSNRFTVLDRIAVPDPTSLAMSPNLDFLAVTNEGADQVSFISTDPNSSRFHTVTETVNVGAGPTGVAWDPANEDVLVCNTREGTMSIISASDFRVRRVVRNQLTSPFDVVITPRQVAFGFQREVYFAYILNTDGRVAIFESGPSGLNGWGFDDVIETLPLRFNNPKTLQPDVTNLNSAVWILHEDPLNQDGLPTGLGGGALSNVGITSGTQGRIPIDAGSFGNPKLRDLEFSVIASIGEGPDGLTGIPTDIAFDNQRNQTALTNYTTQFSAGSALSVNGKSIVKPGGVACSAPRFMFLAIPNSTEGAGVVDVIELTSGNLRFDTNPYIAGKQSIQAPGCSGLMDYLRQ